MGLRMAPLALLKSMQVQGCDVAGCLLSNERSSSCGSADASTCRISATSFIYGWLAVMSVPSPARLRLAPLALAKSRQVQGCDVAN